MMNNNKILLITVYNEKAPGIRYLANYLKKNGFTPKVLFFKGNIYNTQKITETELQLLTDIIKSDEYLFIGLSILSSFALEEIQKVVDIIRINTNSLLVIGGAYPTVMHENCAKFGDIVIRGEGEIPILQLAQAIQNGSNWKNIQNLCYYNEGKEYVQNEIGDAVQDLDTIGYPLIGDSNMYFIDNNELTKGDPQLNTYFYELTCSRGCPFNCSYCYSSKFRSLYKGKGKYLRFRSVDNVMEELHEAIEKNPKITEVRFWDEVFSNQDGWVEKFTRRYKKEIGLPFHVWGHPLTIKNDIIEMLKDAGLHRIVTGFQSGSPNVRNNIFRRAETNEQIIQSSKIISINKIPEVYYDLMICHPLESINELKETYQLCLQLAAPFRLNIHGLGFLPGTDIIETAIEKRIYSREEMENMFNASEEEQLKIFYGIQRGYYGETEEKSVWANLIYLTQFMNIRDEVLRLASSAIANKKKIQALKSKIENMSPEEQNKFTIKKTITSKIFDVFKFKS